MEKKFINVWMNPIELFDYCERSGFLDEGETLDVCLTMEESCNSLKATRI